MKGISIYKKGSISIITGSMGEGKTLLMTLLGAVEHENNPDLKILSNYKTSFSETILDVKNLFRRRNALILFDEGTTDLDSRQWMHNTLSTQLIRELRKRRLSLVIAVQHLEFIDKRVRLIFKNHLEVKYNDLHDILYVQNKTNKTSFTIPIDERYFDLYQTEEILTSNYNKKAISASKKARDKIKNDKEHNEYIDSNSSMYG